MNKKKPVMPSGKCIEDWWKGSNNSKHFWEHKDTWTNKEVINEIKIALKYFITTWQ